VSETTAGYRTPAPRDFLGGKMTKSRPLGNLIEEAHAKHNTTTNTFDMFPIGTKVQVITPFEDFMFFSGCETGVVIQNRGEYLSIIVKFDEPWNDIATWNFNPQSLIVVTGENWYNE